jgi:hypothetical protein
MNTGRFFARDQTAVYLIAVVVVIVAFLLLGGGTWMRGMMHEGRSVSTVYLNWPQILVSLGIGFLLGWLVFRRRW